MNPRQLVQGMIRYRNQQVAARELLPWQPAARARFYGEHFAETLRAFGFGQARVWQPDVTKEFVRVYIGKQGYVPVDREGPALSDHGRKAVERRSEVTFSISWLYASQKRPWMDAVEAFKAWRDAMLEGAEEAREEFVETVQAVEPDDPDFVEYALHLLDKEGT